MKGSGRENRKNRKKREKREKREKILASKLPHSQPPIAETASAGLKAFG
jgi:hypothetical protein